VRLSSRPPSPPDPKLPLPLLGARWCVSLTPSLSSPSCRGVVVSEHVGYLDTGIRAGLPAQYLPSVEAVQVGAHSPQHACSHPLSLHSILPLASFHGTCHPSRPCR
jgi:hypothetical protein